MNLNINDNNKKMLLLYIGGSSNFDPISNHYNVLQKYGEYTGEQCSRLVNESGATDFILTSMWGYNYTRDSNGIRHQIITHDIVNALNDSDLGNSPADAVTIKTGLNFVVDFLTDTYNNTNFDSHPDYTDLVNDTVNLARKLISNNRTIKIWVSLPMFGWKSDINQDPTKGGNFSPAALYYETPYKNLISNYQAALSSLTLNDGTVINAWQNNVEGIYFANEMIVKWYTHFDVTMESNNYGNPVCELLNIISDEVHNGYHKKMLWIPPENYGDLEYVLRHGYIANRKNYFDCVIFQPGYFFHSSVNGDKFPILKDEATNNNALLANGSVTGGSKISDTVVGVEMEISDEINSPMVSDNTTHMDRYNQYISYFSNFSYGHHNYRKSQAFYAGEVNSVFNNPIINNRTFRYVKYYYNFGKNVLNDYKSYHNPVEDIANSWNVYNQGYNGFSPGLNDPIINFPIYFDENDDEKKIEIQKNKPEVYGLNWYQSMTITSLNGKKPVGHQEFSFNIPYNDGKMYFGDLNGYNGSVSFVWFDTSQEYVSSYFTTTYPTAIPDNLHFTNYMPPIQCQFTKPWYHVGSLGTRLMEDPTSCGICLTLYPANGYYDMNYGSTDVSAQPGTSKVAYYKLVVKSFRDAVTQEGGVKIMPHPEETVVIEGYLNNRAEDGFPKYLDLSNITTVAINKEEDNSYTISIKVSVNDSIQEYVLERIYPITNSNLYNSTEMSFAVNLTGAWDALPCIDNISFRVYEEGNEI